LILICSVLTFSASPTYAYVERARAFGWHAIAIDGHGLNDIDRAFGEAVTISDRPTVILAQTIKGRGSEEIENMNGWHGKAMKRDQAERAVEELGGNPNITIQAKKTAPLMIVYPFEQNLLILALKRFG
jgi:transketolase